MRPTLLLPAAFALLASSVTQARVDPPERPHIDVPHLVASPVISGDGRFAIVSANFRPATKFSRSKDWQISLLDLEKSVIAKTITPQSPAQFIAIGRSQIFIVPDDADEVICYDLPAFREVRRIKINTTIKQIEVIGDTLLVGMLNDVRGFDARTGEPIKSALFSQFKGRQGAQSRASSAPLLTIGDGVWLNGALYGSDLKPPATLVGDVSGIVALANVLPPHFDDDRDGPAVTRWNVYGRMQLKRINGQPLMSMSENGQQALAIGDTTPAALELVKIEDPNENNPKMFLRVRDLDTGKIDVPIPFAAWFALPSVGSAVAIDTPLVVRGDRLLAIVKSSVFPISMKELTSPLKLPLPLTFELKQSETLMTIDHLPPLKIAALGGVPPLSFSLTSAPAGTAIDAKTGVITFDAKPIRVAAEVAAVSSMTFSAEPSSKARIAAVHARFDDRVQALTGKLTTGIPLAMPMDVVVTDSRNQTAMLRCCVILDFDPANAAKGVDEITAALERQSHPATTQGN